MLQVTWIAGKDHCSFERCLLRVDCAEKEGHSLLVLLVNEDAVLGHLVLRVIHIDLVWVYVGTLSVELPAKRLR